MPMGAAGSASADMPGRGVGEEGAFEGREVVGRGEVFESGFGE